MLVSGFRAISMAARATLRRSGQRARSGLSRRMGTLVAGREIPRTRSAAPGAASRHSRGFDRRNRRNARPLTARIRARCEGRTRGRVADRRPPQVERHPALHGGIPRRRRFATCNFARLAQRLVERGLLERRDALLCVVGDHASPAQALRDFIEAHPGHLPEAQLCATMCAELGPILRGEKEAVQALFNGSGAETLEQF